MKFTPTMDRYEARKRVVQHQAMHVVLSAVILLGTADASRAESLEFVPGSAREAAFLAENSSDLVRNKVSARVADGGRSWVYRLPLKRGDTEYLKLEIANQYLVSVSTDDYNWTTVFDCSELGHAPGWLSLDLTAEAAAADTVYVRFQDRYPQNGWGPYVTHAWLYDLGSGPAMVDLAGGWTAGGTTVSAGVPLSASLSGARSLRLTRRVVIPPEWAGRDLSLYFGGATSEARITWNGKMVGIVPADEDAVLPIPVVPGAATAELSITMAGSTGATSGLWWPIRLGLSDLVANPQPVRRLGTRSLQLERRFAPYDLDSLNWLSGNYLQSILDGRNNLLPFTTNSHGLPSAYHYVHDTARVLLALADEEQYTPVVRLQLAESLFKGLHAARLPGPNPVYALKLDPEPLDVHPAPDGGWQVMYYQDVAEPVCRLHVDFYDHQGIAIPLEGTAAPTSGPDSGAVQQIPLYHGTCPGLPGASIECGGGSGQPLAAPYLHMSIPAGARCEATITDLDKKGQWFIPGTWGPDTVVLPDGESFGPQSADPLSWKSPAFRWILLRGDNTGEYNFSRALLVGWSGAPLEVACTRQDNHVARIAIGFDATRRAPVRVWVIPFDGVTPAMDYPRAMARLLDNKGKVDTGGFDPVRTLYRDDTICAGFAAAAYLFGKYHRPEFSEALRLAKETTDHLMALQREGIQSNELYHPIAACCYLMLAGQPGYRSYLETWADRVVGMQSPDGTWPWLNFQLRCMIALLRAHDTTGDQRYQDAFDRALRTISIQDGHLIWKGKPAPFEETFDGALLAAVQGHEGNLASLPEVLRLADEGFLGDYGYCRCSDLDEYALGFSAKGLHLPTEPKRILRLNEFVRYGPDGLTVLAHPTSSVHNGEYPGPAVAAR